MLPNIEARRSSGFTYPTRLLEVVDVTSHPFKAVTGVAKKGLSQACDIQAGKVMNARNELSLTMYPMVSAVAVTLTVVRLSVEVDLAIMCPRTQAYTNKSASAFADMSSSRRRILRQPVGEGISRDMDLGQ